VLRSSAAHGSPTAANHSRSPANPPGAEAKIAASLAANISAGAGIAAAAALAPGVDDAVAAK